jgi:hypothetical protein
MDEKLEDIHELGITIIKAGEKQSVIQWISGSTPFRVTIANTKIRDGYVKESDLKKAIPYGLDFKDIVTSLPDVRDVENAFHAHSVWTAEDVRNHPDWVLAALSSIYSPILKALMQYIKAKKL